MCTALSIAAATSTITACPASAGRGLRDSASSRLRSIAAGPRHVRVQAAAVHPGISMCMRRASRKVHGRSGPREMSTRRERARTRTPEGFKRIPHAPGALGPIRISRALWGVPPRANQTLQVRVRERGHLRRGREGRGRTTQTRRCQGPTSGPLRNREALRLAMAPRPSGGRRSRRTRMPRSVSPMRRRRT